VVSDRDRRALFEGLAGLLGEERAATMMELLPPVGWGDVMRQADGVALRAEMAELRSELRGEMAELRSELRGEMAELRGEMAELRGELARLEGRVAGLVPKMVVANIGLAATVFGLTLAAAKLA
jgi:hypothetical protein